MRHAAVALDARRRADPHPRSRGPCARMATRRVAGWGGGRADRIAAPRPTRGAQTSMRPRRGYRHCGGRCGMTAAAMPSRRGRVGRTASRRFPIGVAAGLVPAWRRGAWPGGAVVGRIALPRPAGSSRYPPTSCYMRPARPSDSRTTPTTSRRRPPGVVLPWIFGAYRWRSRRSPLPGSASRV